MKKLRRLISIDYSMSSPAICVYNGKFSEFDFDKCHFYYMSAKKKLPGEAKNIHGTLIKSYKGNLERFGQMKDWVLEIIGEHEIDLLIIEGYAMQAKGKVFDIAENTGIMKYGIYKNNVIKDYITPAPTAMKKFKTGKGNATKEILYDLFLAETGKDLIIENFPTKATKILSPVSDIVDSYFLAQFGISTYTPRV